MAVIGPLRRRFIEIIASMCQIQNAMCHFLKYRHDMYRHFFKSHLSSWQIILVRIMYVMRYLYEGLWRYCEIDA